MNKSEIEWTEYTWNPVSGCSPISEGCEHCYAARTAKRLVGRYGYPVDEPFRVTLHPDRLDEPLHWRKSRIVFVCSMGDLFHDQVPFEFILKIFITIHTVKDIDHIFIFLTKRPKRMLEFWDWYKIHYLKYPNDWYPEDENTKRLSKNIWLGVTVENQQRAEERIPILLQIPAAVHFISYEPALAPLNLSEWINQLQWVIAGGETGPEARLVHPEWVKLIRDQCKWANVLFFFKSWGGKWGGRLLDGQEWSQMPPRK